MEKFNSQLTMLSQLPFRPGPIVGRFETAVSLWNILAGSLLPNSFELPCHIDCSRFRVSISVHFQTVRSWALHTRRGDARTRTCTQTDDFWLQIEDAKRQTTSDALNKLVYVLTSHLLRNVSKNKTSMCVWIRLWLSRRTDKKVFSFVGSSDFEFHNLHAKVWLRALAGFKFRQKCHFTKRFLVSSRSDAFHPICWTLRSPQIIANLCIRLNKNPIRLYIYSFSLPQTPDFVELSLNCVSYSRVQTWSTRSTSNQNFKSHHHPPIKMSFRVAVSRVFELWHCSKVSMVILMIVATNCD